MFQEPSDTRNYKGFSYKKYLKTLKIFGTIKASKINLIKQHKKNLIFFAKKVTNSIKEKIDNILPKKQAELLKGLLIGDTSSIDEQTKESFKISNLSHVLAVSGMQVAYIITSLSFVLNKMIGKQKAKIVIIFVLILYVYITGLSPSILRATIMGIVLISSNLFFRKNDIWNTMALSLLLMLIYNPFLICNIGLKLSYLGTIGIITFYSTVLKLLNNIKIKNRKLKYKINLKSKFFRVFKETLAVTLSAQIAVFPVIIYSFNLFGTYFLITNLLSTILIGPITIIGALMIVFSYIFFPISKILSYVVHFFINLLTEIANISCLPFSKVYFITPKFYIIIIIYILLIILNYILNSYYSSNLSITQKRLKNIIALIKYKIKLNNKKYQKIIILILIITVCLTHIPKQLQVNFVDVGQGDCTFITTPKNKTILIDGGGSASDEYDVGKSTLLPYILDRGYKKIDYMIISHFDNDHVGRFILYYE